MKTLIDYHLEQWKAFYDGQPWYGDSFLTIVGDITEEEALHLPANRHSIVRLLWHMVKWRKALTERLTGRADYRADVTDPDNWPEPDMLGPRSWQLALDAFAEQQRLLIELLGGKTDDFLAEEFLPGKTYGWLIAGVLQHDLYHLGQIAFLKSCLRHSSDLKASNSQATP